MGSAENMAKAASYASQAQQMADGSEDIKKNK